MNIMIRPIVVVMVLLLLQACGSTSGIKADGADVPSLDLSTYDTVVVQDFRDATDKSKIKAGDLEEYEQLVALATRNFADYIVIELRNTQSFTNISREPVAQDAVVISGDITRLVEGSAGLRLFIGMGAGSSYFDADVEITRYPGGGRLGEIVVDKNSWGLGGAIAATQTVESFMKGAAKKIAAEMAAAKSGAR